VLILGDLFEVWVGDDSRYEGFEARCAAVLKQAAEQRYVPRILNTVWIEPDDVVRRAHRGALLRRLVACTIQAMCDVTCRTRASTAMQCQQVKGPAVSLGKIAPAARPT